MLFGVSRAAETTFKEISFLKSNYATSVQNYTTTWTYEVDNFKLTLTNFNNNQKGWDYVKCGTKSSNKGTTQVSTASISTSTPIPEAISSVGIVIDAILSNSSATVTLEVASDSEFKTITSTQTATAAQGTLNIPVSNPTANAYYKMTFDCTTTQTSNGVLTISKLQFNADNSSVTPSAWVAFKNSYPVKVGETIALFENVANAPSFTYEQSGYGEKPGELTIDAEKNTITGKTEGSVKLSAKWEGNAHWNSGSKDILVDVAPASQQGDGETSTSSYKIIFKKCADNANDNTKADGNTTAITTSTSLADFIDEGEEFLSKITSTDKAYRESAYGMKFSTSSVGGKLVLSLSDKGKIKVGKYVVVCKNYKTNTGAKIKLNNIEQTIPAGEELQTVEFFPTTQEEITELNISFTNRGYIYSIEVCGVEDGSETQPSELVYSAATAKVAYNAENPALPTLTNKNGIAVEYESSNENVATISNEGKVSLKAIGTTIITASPEDTKTYSGDASYTLTLTPAEGQILTVAEALAAIENGYEGAARVKGIISEITSLSSQYTTARYYIKDDLSDESSLYIYNGKWLNGEDFTGIEFKVGDVVTVEGSLTNYQGKTPEMENSKVIEFEGSFVITLSFEKDSYSVELGEEFILPELKIASASTLSEEDLTEIKKLVSYSVSENEGIARLENGSVVFNTNIEGTVTVTASIGENDKYIAEATSFTLTVYDPNSDVIELKNFDQTDVNASSYVYTTWTSPNTGIKYALGSMYSGANVKDSFNLRAGTNSGLVVLDNPNGRYLEKIVVEVAGGNNSGRALNVYGNKEAYTYTKDNNFPNGSLEGDKFTYSIDCSTETSVETIIDETPIYWGLKPNSGTLTVKKIIVYYTDTPNVTIAEGNFDAEWGDVVFIEGLHLNSYVADEDELAEGMKFVFTPTWEEKPATECNGEGYDEEEGLLAQGIPCPGLYEVAVKSSKFTVNGASEFTIGQANLYPSHTGLTLSYLNNLGVNRTFEVGTGELTYQFETSSEDATWIHDYCKTPTIAHSLGNSVEIWYKLHNLEGVEVPSSTPKEIVKRVDDTDLNSKGFTQVTNDKIDLTELAYADLNSVVPKISFVLRMNDAETPLSDINPEESTALVNISRDNNVNTGVEAIGAEEGDAEYFTLQGVKVQNPEKGIFIKVTNGNAVKVVL